MNRRQRHALAMRAAKPFRGHDWPPEFRAGLREMVKLIRRKKKGREPR